MAVITISRQLGSGGSIVAQLVADELKFHLLDREIVDAVAERAHVSPDVAGGVDERTFGGASGLFYSLLIGIQPGRLTPESYVYFATRVIREAAARGSFVILGRGGQVALGKDPLAFHVHVAASLEDRAARLVERDRVSKEDALRRIRESDECRRAYVLAAGQRSWEDPALYDLVVNTSRLSLPFVAAMIVEAAREAGVVQRANVPARSVLGVAASGRRAS